MSCSIIFAVPVFYVVVGASVDVAGCAIGVAVSVVVVGVVVVVVVVVVLVVVVEEVLLVVDFASGVGVVDKSSLDFVVVIVPTVVRLSPVSHTMLKVSSCMAAKKYKQLWFTQHFAECVIARN